MDFDQLVQARVREGRPAAEVAAQLTAEALADAEPEVASRVEALSRAELRPAWTDAEVRIVALKAMSYTVLDIAKETKLPIGKVRRVLSQARREGLLEDVESRMMHEAVPLAVENAIELLKSGDPDMTLEVLKGRGVFKSHAVSKGTGEDAGPRSIALIVKVEHQTADGSRVAMASGAVVSGTPRSMSELNPAAVLDPDRS